MQFSKSSSAMIAVRMMCLNSHSLEQLSSVWPLPTADDELRWILIHSYFLHLRLSRVINNISCSNEVSVEVSACWLFSKCHSALFAAKQCNKAWNKKWWKRFHSPRLPAKEKVISGALFGWAEEASMRGALLVLLRNRTKDLSSITESFCRQANAGESWSNQRIIINKF